ncbi:MAG: hypothetical protein ACYC0L_06165 [Thermoleophilia bacterium]
MISRAAALAIAESYNNRFWNLVRYSMSRFNNAEIYDFLYTNEYEPWFLNATQQISTGNERGLQDFIMQIHTGESIVGATPDWPWQERLLLGQSLLLDLAKDIVNLRNKDPEEFDGFGDSNMESVKKMVGLLELDGYAYQNGIFLAPENSVLDTEEEQGVLEGLIALTGLHESATIKHCLELSSENYLEGSWDNSIHNSRRVLEGILQQVAARHALQHGQTIPAAEYSRAVRMRMYLEDAGLLSNRETKAISEIYGLLSETGSHPFIAEKDQARLMRHLALTLSQFVLLRLKGFLEI